MNKLMLSLAAAAAIALPVAPAALAQEALQETRIPFADNGGIRNFRVVDEQTVYIEGNGGKWYRARLMSPCFDIQFRDALGFESNPNGSFDRFSSIRTRGRDCPVQSLVLSGPPPKKRG